MTRVFEHAAGISWVQEETMERASHALGDAGGVWLIDPVDDAEPLGQALKLGPIRGVIQLLDRHPRANAELAERYSVPLHHLPEPGALRDTPFEIRRTLWLPVWKELLLWWPATRTLVVSESYGSGEYFRIGKGPIGVHPMLRLVPPGAPLKFTPAVFLSGHGDPVTGVDAAAGLTRAHAKSRTDLVYVPGKLLGAAASLRP